MNLTFLTPVLLAGCALIAIPIIIHLILKKKPKHLLFPAFRFLQQKHRTTVQKLRLRHLLLLAMRILLFLLLCWALACPELSGGSTELGDDSPVGLVLIFDTSPSMEYEHEGKSRLEAAKEQAATFLESLPASSKIAVLDTAESGGQFVSRADALKLVQNRRIQAYNRPVTASLEEAYRLLMNPPDMPLLLCVFSDRTAASWNADTVTTVLRQSKQRLKREVPAFYVDLGVREPRNVAITGLSLRQGTTTTALEGLLYGGAGGELIHFEAVVQVTGAPVDSELLLVRDNEVVDRKRLQAIAKHGETIAQRVQFQPIPRTTDVHQGEVRLKGHDALAMDNIRYWSLARVARKVLILSDRERDAEDWQFAIEESPLAITCTVMAPRDVPSNLNPDQYQAVCLMNVARPSQELWEVLRKYLTAGGGVVVLPGEDSDPDAYNTEAAQAVLPAQLVEKLDLEPRGKLAPLDYAHPIMQPFKQWERTSLPGDIRRYWKVQPSGESGREILPLNQTDAKGQLHSAPLLLERTFDRVKTPGRVILCTTAMYQRVDRANWNTFNENWLSLALPLNITRYVLGARDEKQNFQLGEEVRYWLPRGSGLTSYQLAGPQTSTGEIKDRDLQVTVTDARKPGNYKLSAGDSWVRHFSENLNPAETNLLGGGPSPSEIEDLFGPQSLRSLQEGDLRALALDRLGHTPKMELLPYLMIGVLLLLALENLLANRFYRREPEG